MIASYPKKEYHKIKNAVGYQTYSKNKFHKKDYILHTDYLKANSKIIRQHPISHFVGTLLNLQVQSTTHIYDWTP